MTDALADLVDHLGDQKTLATVHGISTAALESLYAATRTLYDQGRRQQAQRNLELLCLYDHENIRFWQALAICRKSQRDYAGAADAYAFAIAQCREFNLDLELDLIGCLVAAGNLPEAKSRLSPLLASGASASNPGSRRNKAEDLASLISRSEASQQHSLEAHASPPESQGA